MPALLPTPVLKSRLNPVEERETNVNDSYNEAMNENRLEELLSVSKDALGGFDQDTVLNIYANPVAAFMLFMEEVQDGEHVSDERLIREVKLLRELWKRARLAYASEDPVDEFDGTIDPMFVYAKDESGLSFSHYIGDRATRPILPRVGGTVKCEDQPFTVRAVEYVPAGSNELTCTTVNLLTTNP